MFIKIRKATIVKLFGPQRPNLESPKTPTFPLNKFNNKKLHPKFGFLIHLLGYTFKPLLKIPYSHILFLLR